MTDSVRWIVLGSGSSGNASLLAAPAGGLLLDGGLAPKHMGSRLRRAGLDWDAIGAMLLTHVHSDHWHEGTLQWLLARRVALHCHDAHRRAMQLSSPAFRELQSAGLVQEFHEGRLFEPLPGLRCRPLPLRHDAAPTFGFRIEGRVCNRDWAVGYAADLGTWCDALAAALANVDLLALEFNHDVPLQRASQRPQWLIDRVLGDDGHLSNEQAARLLECCLRQSQSGRPRHVLQLHLSLDCNSAALARAAANKVLCALGHNARLHTATAEGGVPAIPL